jgi:hypothetical protein
MGVPSTDEVIAYGGIMDAQKMGVRSSDRVAQQPNADATQLERATLNTQRRDDLRVHGKNLNSEFSILALSNDVIVGRANRIGVSFGSSDASRSKVVDIIKDNELNRSLIMLKKKENVENNGPHNLVVSRVSNLCEDLIEDEHTMQEDHELLDTSIEQMVQNVKMPKARKKKSYDTGNVRRSARINFSKRK